MEKFTYKTKEAFFEAQEKFGASLPWSDDLSVLAQPKTIAESDVTLKNSLTVHPMEGFDSEPDGAPGVLTLRK